MVQKVAEKLAGQAAVVQVNIDKNQDLARQFNITGVPAVLLLRNGKIADRTSGALSEDALISWFNRHQT